METTKSAQQVEVQGDTKKYNARREDTVTKFVITREDIEKHGDATVADILNRQAGVVNGNINGLKGYTQYLVDGQTPQAGFRISDIAVSQIERIEIIRSAVAEFSTQAIAGTINIVLQRTVKTGSRKLDLLMTHQDKSAVSKQVRLNLADKYDHFSYDTGFFINRAQNSGEYYEYLERNNKDENLSDIYTRRLTQSTKNTAYSVTQNLTWLLGENESFSIQAYVGKVLASFKVDSRTFRPTVSESTIQNDTFSDKFSPQSNHIKTIWEKPFSASTKMSSTLMLSQSTATTKNHSVMSDGSVAVNSHREIEYWRKTLLWDANILFQQSDNDNIKLGWNVRNENYDSNTADYAEAQVASTLRSGQYALFAQREWEGAEQWSHYIGARWEGFRAELSNSVNQQVKQSTANASPIFQTRWRPHKDAQDQFRLALARTFKNPDQSQLLADSLSFFGQDPQRPYSVSNPNLRPEIAWGLDTTFEHFGENELNYSLSHYFKSVKNLIRDQVFFENNRWQQQSINSGDAISHGIVLDTRLPLGVVLKDAPKIYINANMSRNWSHVNDVPGPNNRFAEQAKYNANFSVEYKVNDAWKVAGSYRFISGGPLRVAADRINLEQVKRYTSLTANWTINKETSFRLAVSNLLKQTQITQTRIWTPTTSYYSRGESPSILFASARLSLKF
ncbi:TonB-dependent receptor [Undibacterium cyanobacteriorum]|uniref:TonB-dependent receptor n=1 Tax=Undibacterium cyanobacteriorum TaxID=3073561 RepID=A0ABY9RKB3_9BURK|nr:TonB-dependent receptor [Undibacterium sp. 20NA77.5]WMW81667.1 TonB-dependent receptor [Undibacterium sp. 20NA77.5]